MDKKLFVRLLIISFILLLSNVSFGELTGDDWSLMDSGTTYNLVKVWGNSSTDVFAIGEDTADYTHDNIIIHYDGNEWSEVYHTSIYTLNGIWGSSSSDVYVAGYTEEDETWGSGIILHYDGSAWSKIMDEYDTFGTKWGFDTIWCSSPTDIFTLGDNGWDFQIIHYDGSAWSVVWTSEDMGETQQSFLDIWGSSPSDVFVSGKSVVHYDGSTWSKMESDTIKTIDGDNIWGLPSGDVYTDGGGPAEILHYDGSTWSAVEGSITYLPWRNSIWCSSPSNIIVPADNGEIYHFDGVAWLTIETEVEKDLNDIWGSSATDVFIVGGYGTIFYYTAPDVSTTTVPATSTTTTVPGGATTTVPVNTTTTDGEPCPSELIYGEHSEEAELLRYVRDTILSHTPEGREIIRLYYQWSPVIVKAMEGDEKLKEEAKEVLDGVLEMIRG